MYMGFVLSNLLCIWPGSNPNRIFASCNGVSMSFLFSLAILNGGVIQKVLEEEGRCHVVRRLFVLWRRDRIVGREGMEIVGGRDLDEMWRRRDRREGWWWEKEVVVERE
ncbi:hypothetical protein HA466_0144770 [Hirschfeldia incana]|nr:hypothetical protein HA466_0144770 [Hirschfeldia incana]